MEFSKKSRISQIISTGEYFPSPTKLPDSNVTLPLAHIGDEAFRLDRHMMRPKSRIEAKKDDQKTTFNYRLSRARRTTENSFGLLSQIFKVFYTPIPLKTETVDNLVLTACAFIIYFVIVIWKTPTTIIIILMIKNHLKI